MCAKPLPPVPTPVDLSTQVPAPGDNQALRNAGIEHAALANKKGRPKSAGSGQWTLLVKVALVPGKVGVPGDNLQEPVPPEAPAPQPEANGASAEVSPPAMTLSSSPGEMTSFEIAVTFGSSGLGRPGDNTQKPEPPRRPATATAIASKIKR